MRTLLIMGMLCCLVGCTVQPPSPVAQISPACSINAARGCLGAYPPYTLMDYRPQETSQRGMRRLGQGEAAVCE